MDNEKIYEIVNDVTNKSNKDLLDTTQFLSDEFEKTKELIINLTKHMDSIEDMYNILLNELQKRNVVQ